jgi:Ca2+-binding EF-hand superfamily protein
LAAAFVGANQTKIGEQAVPISFRHAFAPLILAALTTAASAQTTPSASQPRTKAQLTQGLGQRFNALDSNRDGNINKSEIEAAAARARREADATIAKRAEEGFARLDTDKNGQLSLAEFKASIPPMQARPADTVLQRLDANKDGRITLQEFGAPTIAIFDRLDANKDGTVSDQEINARRSAAPTGR